MTQFPSYLFEIKNCEYINRKQQKIVNDNMYYCDILPEIALIILRFVK